MARFDMLMNTKSQTNGNLLWCGCKAVLVVAVLTCWDSHEKLFTGVVVFARDASLAGTAMVARDVSLPHTDFNTKRQMAWFNSKLISNIFKSCLNLL